MNTILATTEIVVYTPLENFFYNTREGQVFLGGLSMILLAVLVGFVVWALVESKLQYKRNGHTIATVIGVAAGLLAGYGVFSYIF